MLKRLTIVFLVLTAMCSFVAAQSQYVVTANSLNVRSGPGSRYSVVGKLHRGDTVIVYEQNGQWATIQGFGGRCYVSSRYICYVWPATQKSSAKAVSNWGLNNGYVCGEWWRSDRGTNWWEICMYDRQNRYNESWRIRPIYSIHAHNGLMQRIPGGPAHWLFRKQVVADMKDSVSKHVFH